MYIRGITMGTHEKHHHGKVKGKLNRETMKGIGIPLNAPVYGNPPYYYKDANWTIFNYETDPEKAAELLPSCLELTDPPVASVIFIDYHFSTLGSYKETALTVTCTYKGEPYTYIAYLMVDNPVGILAGREIWGFPKKYGKILFSTDGAIHYAQTQRPEGLTLATGVWRFVAPFDVANIPASNYLLLRSIPGLLDNHGKPQEPTLQIVQPTMRIKFTSAWTIDGSCTVPETSSLSPWGATLPVVKPLPGLHVVFDGELDTGKLITEM